MLEIKSLTKQFGDVKALNNVSLSINKGDRVAVIGRSGAGKSTLLRCINRLESPTSGDIFHLDDNITTLKGRSLTAWRAKCAMIFQQFQLVPRIDVLTNVLIGTLKSQPFLFSMVKHFPEADRARAIIELSRLNMETTALQRAGTLSGGQQQRVAIARAMMQKPELVLADEPIASLDPSNAHAVMQSLQTINEERGITMLINLHSIEMARKYCKRVIGLCDGEVVFDGPIGDLTNDTLNKIYKNDTQESAFEFEGELA